MICPITQGATFDCDNPLQPGVENRFILINLTDIASYTVTNNAVTNIQLKGGTSGYLFDGVRQSIQPSHEYNEEGLVNGYKHQLSFEIYDISSDRKIELFSMGVNRFAAIVFNMPVAGNEDGYFEVFGLQAGMEPTQIQRNNRGNEDNIGYSITLNTGDLVNESKIPFNFFDTDYSTTLAKILALLSPGDGFPYILPYILS